MLRIRTLASLGLLFCLAAAPAKPQQDLSSRLQRITAPIRHAGVYHVATGTWTRDGSLAELTGPDIIYNNTCAGGDYFTAQLGGEKWQHRSRVPSPTGPTFPSAEYGPPRKDAAPGCLMSYTINGFQFGYCSASTSPVNFVHEFAHSYTACGAVDLVPAFTFTLSGLPAGTPSGSQQCWTVDVDLSATSPPFVLMADGDGVYVGPPDMETFGWSVGPTSPVGASDLTGPVIAGNFTWNGGPFSGPMTPCTGTDGTIWDSPVDLSEPGTGMGSLDFFRIAGTATTAPQGPGCYYFGGTPHADFHLEFYSNTGCVDTPAMTAICLPGQGGVIPCPCDNPPAGGGLGCNNFGTLPVESGTLGASGDASLGFDTLVLEATGENNSSLTVFWTGKDPVHPTGLPHGAGVRCITNTLRRLYTGNASGGAIARPGSGDPSVSVRTAAVGTPILSGETRHYFNIYRDPNAATPCGSASATINLTNAGSVTWGP